MKSFFLFLSVVIPSFILSNECFQANIISPTPFMGNNDELFKLDNGMIGEVKYEYEYMYEYYPAVIVCPSKNKMIVKNKNLTIKIINMPTTKNKGESSNIIESSMDGDFNGWEGETIFKLSNGQIWQQSSYAYTYHYAYSPKVLIIKSGNLYKMQVEGVSSSINVTRLK